MCTGLGLEVVELVELGLVGLVGLEEVEEGKVVHRRHHSRSMPRRPEAIMKRLGALSPKRA